MTTNYNEIITKGHHSVKSGMMALLVSLTRSSMIILITVALISCGNSDDDLACLTDIEFEPILINMADNLIIPSYESMEVHLDSLSNSLEAFELSADEGSLSEVRLNFESAYKALLRCEQYEFGPAEAVAYRASCNNFPLNIQELEENISTGIYDLDDVNRYDKGYPALDYLLYGTGDNAREVVNFLTGNPEYLEYAQAVVEDMIDKTQFISSSWSGAYRDDFISDAGTQAGSSMSLLVNALNQNFEITKRDRLGIPSGVLTLDFPNPDKVEAPHSQLSLELMINSLNATIDFYLGRGASNVDRMGFDDILINIGAEKDSRSLDEVIREQYDLILEAVGEINGPLSRAVEEDSEDVVTAYAEASRQVIHTKTDMSSVMCISITYVDAPSDTD